MLATQGILALALLAVGLAVGWSLRKRALPNAQSTAILAVALWATASAIVWWRGDSNPGSEGFRGRSLFVQSLDSLAWPASPTAPIPATPPTAAAVQAASVESLIGRLEARLADQPDDANGWALLAQSYAYTSNEEAVEHAVQRAVALGFDEAALRNRVAGAKRAAPVGDWFDRVMQPKRP